ncbi:MAG TPA: DUF2892 domain-containing protein [Solirubrobacteraceae bacterium]|jgi:hypothetical protein
MSSTACSRPVSQHPTASNSSWPLERILFGLAGSMTLLSATLAALVSPWFLLLTGFVGVSQWLYVLVGACPASLVLRRLFSLQSVLYPRQEASS